VFAGIEEHSQKTVRDEVKPVDSTLVLLHCLEPRVAVGAEISIPPRHLYVKTKQNKANNNNRYAQHLLQ
jgi:hypothetical protein